MDLHTTLQALEQLASSPSTSSSGPLNALLDEHFARARQRLSDGEDPKGVITDLQKQVARSKKEVEKGLKGWYNALGNVGKAVDKHFPPNLAAISDAYTQPALFSEGEAPGALDRAVLDSIARQGLWEAMDAFEEEAGVRVDEGRRSASHGLHEITSAIQRGDVGPALQWCAENAAFLSSPPHPSALPYHLHRSVFLRMTDQAEAIRYAGTHLMPYTPTQPVLQLITSCLYPPTLSPTPMSSSGPGPSSLNGSNGAAANGHGGTESGMDIDDTGTDGHFAAFGLPHIRSPYVHESAPLVAMFQAEYCRLHGWPKEDPLEVAADLGSRGGGLAAIEKARKVMGERLGPVRTWTDLPMEIPLPDSRRYHSVFVCPVSKEQASAANPPKMLLCGHVLASESFGRMMKGGRRQAKCPYCPMETSTQAAQRLYF